MNGEALTFCALALGLGFPGACTAPGGPDDGDPECTVDADCDSGERCAAGQCVPDDTSTNGNPQPECTTDTDCPTGEHCTSSGTCEADEPGDTGECTDNTDCAATETCTPESLCVPTEGEQPCAVDADCLTGEICSPAGFCADAADPDPPGQGGAGGGGGGGGGDGGDGDGGDGDGDMDTNGGDMGTNGDGGPECAQDTDCAVDEVCSNGTCDPVPPAENAKQVMAGCWRLTFSAPEVASQVAIYQFDASGDLERTWTVNPVSGATTEEVRYTVDNAPFWTGLVALAEQDVFVDPTHTTLRLATGLIFYDFGVTNQRCLVRRTTVCTDLTQIDATLSSSGQNGPAPDTLSAGTLAGSQSCESTSDEDLNFEVPLSSTVTGEKLTACPNPADPLVRSQEEQGDLCP